MAGAIGAPLVVPVGVVFADILLNSPRQNIANFQLPIANFNHGARPKILSFDYQ